MMFNGTKIDTYVINQLTIPANNRVTQRISLLLPTLDLNTTYVRLACYNYTSGALLDSTLFYYVRPINWTLPVPDL